MAKTRQVNAIGPNAPPGQFAWSRRRRGAPAPSSRDSTRSLPRPARDCLQSSEDSWPLPTWSRASTESSATSAAKSSAGAIAGWHSDGRAWECWKRERACAASRHTGDCPSARPHWRLIPPTPEPLPLNTREGRPRDTPQRQFGLFRHRTGHPPESGYSRPWLVICKFAYHCRFHSCNQPL